MLPDSLSSLQAISNLKHDQDFRTAYRYGDEIVFIRIPGHVGIRQNSTAESAAKDAPVLTCIYFQRLLCSDELCFALI